MSGQPWLAATLAVIMIVTAGYCLTRLGLSWRRGRGTDRQADTMHVLMGVAMAGMLVPQLRLSWTGGWELVFGTVAATLVWRMFGQLRRRREAGHRTGHLLQHLLGCAAMLYVLVTGGALAAKAARGAIAAGPATAGGMTGGAMTAAGDSATLALGLAVALLASVVLTADRITSLPRVAVLAAAPGRTASASPAYAARPAAPSRPCLTRREPGQNAIVLAHRRGTPLSPRLSACCEIAMGLTMGYMLITML